jgi:hypothetical protein
MAITKKTLFAENLDKYNTFVTDTDPLSKYFKLTELPDTFTGGKNAFLIQGSEYLVADSLIKIELKDAKGDIIYHEPGEGIISASVGGEQIITEYYEGVSKLVSVYIYPDTSFGPCTLTILGELSSYDNNGINTPIPANWEGSYNVKWQKEINVVPSLANSTKIRFYRRPTVQISEILSPIYSIVNDEKVASAVTQSFANIKLSNLETFAGDVKRIKVFRTSIGDISDYDLIQDILVESKELLTTYGLSGSVVGNTGIFTAEVLKNQWNSGSLTAILDSSRVEAGVRLNGNGNFIYTQSLDLRSTNTYELNLDAFYSASTNSNLGIYLSQVTTSTDGITPLVVSSSIATLSGIQPTKNLLDTTIPFKIDRNYPSASLYFSQSQGQWHVGNVSLKLSEDTAFSPDEVSFITTMPTVLGNETFNFKFEFYDVNNNYVPVAVTQSALFNGGNTNIGGTILLISSSTSQSLADLNRVSQSISGTATLYSSSANTTIVTLSGSVSGTIGTVSGSVFTLSGSVSGTIGTLSGSISQSVALTLSSSLSKVQQLADGNYSGVFIDGTTVFAPVIGGTTGYISGKFTVGAPPNSIVLDATTSTRRIYIGTGTYSNTNTNVYLDSTGKFSLGDKLSWSGTALSLTGEVIITSGTTKTAIDNAASAASAAQTTADTANAAAIAVDGKVFTDSSGKLAKTPSPSSSGLYLGSTFLGYYNGSAWKTYMANNGNFFLSGTGDNGLSWNGTTLNITGDVVITGGSTKTAIDNAATAASNAQGTANSAATAASNAQTTADTANATAIAVDGKVFTDSTGKLARTPSLTSSGLFLGSEFLGYYNGSNWKTYMSNTGNFFLSGAGTNGLSWNGTTLSITGEISVTGGNAATTTALSDGLSGKINTGAAASDVNSNSTTISGGKIRTGIVESTGYSYSSGDYSAAGTQINLDNGLIRSKNFVITSAGDAKFRGNITATGGSFTGDVTAGGVTIGTSGITITGTYGINVNAALGIYVQGDRALSGYTSLREFENGREANTGENQSEYNPTLFTWYTRNQNAGQGAICGIAASTGNLSFYGNGGVRAYRFTQEGGGYTNASDRRLKDNINKLDDKFGIEFINKLNPVEFVYKREPQYKKFGFIAQEVSSSLLDYGMNLDNSTIVQCEENKNKTLAIDYTEFITPLIKSVQQLSARIEELEAKLSGSI